jgi:hypothetical protein
MISKSNCRSIAAAATFLCATSAFAQENRGTPEQRAACTSDAFRLCSSYIPDATKVEYCLRQNKSDLSDACRSVFEKGGNPLASKSK